MKATASDFSTIQPQQIEIAFIVSNITIHTLRICNKENGNREIITYFCSGFMISYFLISESDYWHILYLNQQ